MMLRIIICLSSFGWLLISGCEQSRLQEQVASLRAENESIKEELVNSSEYQTNADKSQKLVHVVLFKLKPELTDASLTKLIAAIEKLTQIDVVKELEIGKFTDLGDKRAMNEFQLVMSMKFDTKKHYHEYQDHPVHVSLKKVVGDFIAGPPATYDYWEVPISTN